MVKKMNISAKDKSRLNAAIARAESSFKDPYIMSLSPAAYSAVMQGLREHDLTPYVTAAKLQSGRYMISYHSGYKKEIENVLIEKAYLLGDAHRPTMEDVEVSAYSSVKSKAKASLLVFDHLSPEMAEKVMEESEKKGIANFAKELKRDGTYSVTCMAGETKEQKDEIYQEACRIMLKSALSLSGELGKIEKKRMLHMAKEYQQIDDMLDAVENFDDDVNTSGYIYSIHSQDGKIVPDDYIKFDENKYTTCHGDVMDKTRYADKNNPHEYKRNLRFCIFSGTGQKVYIPTDKMNELLIDAADAKKLLADCPQNPLDAMTYLQNKNEKIRAELADAQKEKNTSMIHALKNEKRKCQIAIEAVSEYKGTDLNIPDSVFENRAIAAELDQHQFKMYATTEQAAKIETERKFINWSINDMKVNGQLDFTNNLKESRVLIANKMISKIKKEFGFSNGKC